MAFKSNTEYWDELKAKGWLYEYLKDGVPEGFAHQLLGLAYPVTIFAIVVIAFIFYLRLPTDKKRPRSLVVSVGIATVLGWTWGIWMLHADPVFPGWIFPPWAGTNIDVFMPIDDLFFYPASTTLFYIIYRNIDLEEITSHRGLIINTVIVVYLLIILFYLSFTALCGRAVSLLFAVPGLLLFIYARDLVNVKKFLYFLVILVSINCIWDWLAVSWIHSLEGMAWASQWAYISFNQAGEHIQSSVFLDYKAYPWAWIFNNPIEGTPWLGLSGAMLDFSLFAAVDKFISARTMNKDVLC